MNHEALLREAVEKLNRYAKRQGPRRMLGKSFSEGTVANSNEGCHYPAVESLISRIENALREKKKKVVA